MTMMSKVEMFMASIQIKLHFDDAGFRTRERQGLYRLAQRQYPADQRLEVDPPGSRSVGENPSAWRFIELARRRVRRSLCRLARA
jgi:hypothetical protein